MQRRRDRRRVYLPSAEPCGKYAAKCSRRILPQSQPRHFSAGPRCLSGSFQEGNHTLRPKMRFAGANLNQSGCGKTCSAAVGGKGIDIMLRPSEAQPEGDLLGKKLKRFFFSLSPCSILFTWCRHFVLCMKRRERRWDCLILKSFFA